MPKVKTLQPAPVYAATYENGNVIRLSFQQPIGKPFDVTRVKRLADLMVAGETFRTRPSPYLRKLAQYAALRDTKTAAVRRVESLRRKQFDFKPGTPERIAFDAELREALEAEKAAGLAFERVSAPTCAELDAHLRAESEFKRNWRAPIIKAEISHHTVGTIDANSLPAETPKRAKKPDIAAAVREIIKEAIDAESALARIAALVSA